MKSAFCTFCDDVRQEVSGKLIYVGVYVGEMVVPAFPITIPSLQLVMNVWQSRDEDASNAMKVFVSQPGGWKNEFAFDCLAAPEAAEAILADPEVENLTAQFFIALKNLSFTEETRLKVDVEVAGHRMRAGSLKVRAAQPT